MKRNENEQTTADNIFFKQYADEIARRIYKYFRLHKEMLENEDFRAVYELAKAQDIRRYSELFGEGTPEEIGELKDMLYDFEAKCNAEKVESYRESVMDFIAFWKSAR